MMAQLAIVEVLATGPGLRRTTGKFGNVTFKLRRRRDSTIAISTVIPRQVPVGAFRFAGYETADVKIEFVRTGRVVTFNFTGWTVTAAVRQLANVTDLQEAARITVPFTGVVMGINLDA